ALGEREQTGQAIQSSRFAAAGGAEQGDELALVDFQAEPGQRVLAAEATGHAVQAQSLEGTHFFTFAPPISRSHLSKAATSDLASSGTSRGLLAISCSYSGRPYSPSACWLSGGAIDSGTSLSAGPG